MATSACAPGPRLSLVQPGGLRLVPVVEGHERSDHSEDGEDDEEERTGAGGEIDQPTDEAHHDGTGCELERLAQPVVADLGAFMRLLRSLLELVSHRTPVPPAARLRCRTALVKIFPN